MRRLKPGPCLAHQLRKALLPPEQVRRITVTDALVDTGATILSLPGRLIRQLGLTKKYRKRVRSSVGVTEADVYGTVRLTIQGRDCPTDVMELPEEGRAAILIGQIPLEYLDFAVDRRAQGLIGNPAHDGKQMFEVY